MIRKFIPSTFLLMLLVVLSCTHQPYVLPENLRTGDSSLCFERDILPIFVTECSQSGCHDAASHAEGYTLDNYDDIVRKGIVPGNPAASKIYQSLLGNSEERMPQGEAQLSDDKIALIKKWIVAGAIKDNNCEIPCDSNNYTYSTAIQPLVTKYCLNCHYGSTPDGDVGLETYSDVKNAVEKRNLLESIHYTPGYSGMPRGGLRLTKCQIRQFEQWIDAGMPNN